MSSLLGVDNLKLYRLAGGSVISYPPLYAPTGDSLFLISENAIHIYSTSTGLHIRELEGSNHKIIGMQLELRNEEILVACTANGELLRWKWSTGQLKRRTQLKIEETACLTSFHQLDWYGDSETANIFVLYQKPDDFVKWRIFETTKGHEMNVPCTLFLNTQPAIAAVNTGAFKIIAIAQQERLYFINYETFNWIGLTNGLSVPITCMQWHPAEETLAVGDNRGRIMLWREFWTKETVKNRLYHWHSTPVTSVAFTQSGSGFYSSGMEAVLVVWNVERPEMRKFVPHITCVVRHIAVSKANVQVAISTLDNGVQILGNDNQVKCNLQEFTFSPADKTQKNGFPIGLRTNPRGSSLVLNGRTGHLQFYSTHTRSLLYNMDIVAQNQLTMEVDRILYNLKVTKAAFNVNWMATGEVFNDEEHFPELRLKFWKYLESSQSYTLNTNIELPHEGGFRAIEFSSAHHVENLRCATVGEDNTIKVWALEDTDNIYKKGKVWFCIAETNYKQTLIESIAFSQDGSLLAAGCGNTLCIFKAETLKLKSALSSSPANDGCISKAVVQLPTKQATRKQRAVKKVSENPMPLFKNMFDTADEALLKKLKRELKKVDLESVNFPVETETFKNLDKQQKSVLYERILGMNQLNLFQKLLIFQRLGIKCEVAAEWREKALNYLSQTIHEASLNQRLKDLHLKVQHINLRSRFKAKYRLQQYMKRRKEKTTKTLEAQLVPIMKVLGLEETCRSVSSKSQEKSALNGGLEDDFQLRMDVDEHDDDESVEVDAEIFKDQSTAPFQTLANIKHVQFAANEFGHLIIACTESRVLIWNLLSLRLESSLILSVEHLALDPLTNQVAAFTKNNGLYIFQPHNPVPIYSRKDLPTIYGAAWLPRRYPKRTSILIDWQAQSHLYFLTETQEIMYLHNPSSQELVDLPPVTFTNPADTIGLRYSTFGTFAMQQYTDKNDNASRESGPLIVGRAGKTAVKVLVDLSTHTMPPLSLVCNDFMKSLVKPADSTTTTSAAATEEARSSKNMNGGLNGGVNVNINGGVDSNSETEDDNVNDDDDEETAEDSQMMNGNAFGSSSSNKTKFKNKTKAAKSRKVIAAKSEEIKAKHEKHKTKEQNEKLSIEMQLKRIAATSLQLEF